MYNNTKRFQAMSNYKKEIKGITIDNETTRDIDDAIWVENKNGNLLLSVCVTNAAVHVPRNSRYLSAVLI
ncbi:MAG: hypothetical protein A2096_10425 [Spirochaetes bacterium GWF1_41_5]|nr:MAG: hypothetical protein A2096_10425 [Spirochaetes bacterium GWF1_41_5]